MINGAPSYHQSTRGGFFAAADRRVVYRDVVVHIVDVVVVHPGLVVEVQMESDVIARGRPETTAAPTWLALRRLDFAQLRGAAELVEAEVQRTHARAGEPHVCQALHHLDGLFEGGVLAEHEKSGMAQHLVVDSF